MYLLWIFISPWIRTTKNLNDVMSIQIVPKTNKMTPTPQHSPRLLKKTDKNTIHSHVSPIRPLGLRCFTITKRPNHLIRYMMWLMDHGSMWHLTHGPQEPHGMWLSLFNLLNPSTLPVSWMCHIHTNGATNTNHPTYCRENNKVHQIVLWMLVTI
jgi:hypothetical protein